jgi:hypothetical protein
VRGFRSVTIDGAQNIFEHTIHVSYHIVIPESQHEVAHRFQDSGSVRITFAILGVVTTIELHDELGIRAEEIDDKVVDRHLPLKLPSVQSPIA